MYKYGRVVGQTPLRLVLAATLFELGSHEHELLADGQRVSPAPNTFIASPHLIQRKLSLSHVPPARKVMRLLQTRTLVLKEFTERDAPPLRYTLPPMGTG